MKSKKKSSYSMGDHLKFLGILTLLLGLPLSFAAAFYQQTMGNSQAEVLQTTNEILPRPSLFPQGCYYSFDYKNCPATGLKIPCATGEKCNTCPQILVCPSITPEPKPAGFCGTVKSIMNGRTTYVTPPDAESCFLQAFQTCTAKSLNYFVTSVDSGQTHQFSIQNTNGSCSITDTAGTYIVPRPSTKNTYTCTGVTQQNNGLLVTNCGTEGNIIIPAPSSIQVSISPKPSCYPRPPCLDGKPRCLIAEPRFGWCPPTGTPSIQPSISINPKPTCFPRPPCLDSNPACKLPEPQVGWCPPAITSITGIPSSNSVQTTNSFLIYINTLLRSLFGR